MAQDVMSQFYTCLNLPLQEKLRELTKIIDQSSPNKELQSLFPQLMTNIFSTSFNSGWGLRSTTLDFNRMEFELLVSFLEPHGPMFRLCYKLLSDPHLKYNLPLNQLPQNLQYILERGRCPQFYADLIQMDSQGMNVVALALNPFDYYIFSFALHLINNSPNKSYWENWNSVYFALACDYLMHFLPADPNVTVLPLLPHYMGKVPIVAPLQTANRPLCSPSLLLIPDLSGISNQHTPVQTQTRNEVWRSETVLQVFIDIWMSVEDFSNRHIELYQRNYTTLSSSPERVRTVRVLVKHIHAYSAKHMTDPATRSSALRKYARQIMCARAYHYVKDLVATWPLDASFRLVMELWLSLIQPWRYADGSINKDRFPSRNSNQEDGAGVLDGSYAQFIAENFPAYTCLFQLVLPRFMRLDLTAYKNAVMLFRLGKVFSQQHLVTILRDLEQAMTDQNNGVYYSPETSWNTSNISQGNSYNNGVQTNKWVAVAKQAITELNLSTNFQYQPIWSETQKHNAKEFISKIMTSKAAAEKNVEEFNRKIELQNQGIWASIKNWFMISSSDDESSLEECKKVPTYLSAAIHHMSHIFGLNENLVYPEITVTDSVLEQSSFANSTNFALSITKKLRHKPTDVHYMGDPDLAPITSYESTILVRILYQIASRLNDMYQEEFSRFWSKIDFSGYVAREILQRPCTIHTYVKDASYHQNLVSQNLPARLSLRRFGSHACVIWIAFGYMMFRLFYFSGLFYAFFLFVMFTVYVLTKSSLKYLNMLS